MRSLLPSAAPRLAAVLLGLALASPPASVAAGAAAPVARVGVPHGRALLATEDGVRTLLQGDRAVAVEEGAHVEVGVRSRVEVRWSGLASAAVDGKASLSVGAGAEPRLALPFVRRAEVEVRRGSLALELPQGWSTTLGRAAVSVEELADGSVAVTHRGGEPLLLVRRDGDREREVRLASGRSVVLARAPR